MHGLLRCNINTGVHARARRTDVSLRDVTIARDGKRRLASANDVSHRKRAEDLGRFWKDGWFSPACGDLCGGCHKCWGVGRWKSQNRKIVPLTPYVETFNSKVIKGFLPELRSRYVFFDFRDSYVLSLWTFDVCFTHKYIMAMVQLEHPTFAECSTGPPCWLSREYMSPRSVISICHYSLIVEWGYTRPMGWLLFVLLSQMRPCAFQRKMAL